MNNKFLLIMLLIISTRLHPLSLHQRKLLAGRALAALKKTLNSGRIHRILIIHPPTGTILGSLDRRGCFTAQYRPGSLFKLLTAWHLLCRNRLSPGEIFSCKSRFYLFENHRGTGRLIHENENSPGRNDYYKCALLRGHGPLNLIQAIARSCNIYFYNCYNRIDWMRMSRDFRRTGLSMYGGQLFPPQRLTHYILGAVGDRARTSLASAAVFVNTIVNNGRIIRLSDNGRGGSRQIETGKEAWRILRRGMRACVLRGTGRKLNIRGLPPAAGKTGTGRMGESIFRVNGWFLSYAPCHSPTILIAAFSRDSTGSGAPLKNSRFLYKKLTASGYFRR